MDTPDYDIQRVKDALNVLSEHFDSVHIFATKYEGGDNGGTTAKINKGTGNWFARYGQIKDWILCEEHASIKEMDKEDE